MTNPADDGYAAAVIETVRDMQRLVEEHKRLADESRAHLQGSIETMIAAFRTDVHKTITALQISQVEHKASHEADRMERITRQQQVDLQIAELRKWVVAALVCIVATFAFLIGWLVF